MRGVVDTHACLGFEPNHGIRSRRVPARAFGGFRVGQVLPAGPIRIHEQALAIVFEGLTARGETSL